ncbi:hypothetical protein PQR34_45530 [Paraburkholderia sediminicola]|uniref:hypothetical protein n=1 Tax=Paraburkholderia sediminicola TaxID=458836 RepID=UPI0038B98BCC
MKTYDNLQRLIAWWRESPEPATITTLVKAGLLTSGDASNTIQYGMRHGVIQRIDLQCGRPSERTVYRWTGQPSPPAPIERKRGPIAGAKAAAAQTGPSFDALLSAWGIATVPPRLPTTHSPRQHSLDG